jgi:hypothetical protein
MLKKIIVWVLALSLFSMGAFASSIEEVMDASEKTIQEDKVQFEVTSNQMIDLYIIACALYMDFESPVLMPGGDKYDLYKAAKVHFAKYKNHEFLNEFDQYTFYGDINGDAVGVLLSYDDTGALNQLTKVQDQYRKYVFKEDQSIDVFVEGLREFYKDTDAKSFFEAHGETYADMHNFVGEALEDAKVYQLIEVMEAYIGSELKESPDDIGDELEVERRYTSVLTLFRPSMASFYKVGEGHVENIIAFQSPNSFDRNPNKYDVDFMVASMIHEFLHSYINGSVESIVKNKTQNGQKSYSLTDNRMYKNMPIHRQTDEYLVRAIEGRIYTQVFGEAYAFDQLMNKEIKFGGFENLALVYNYLEKYESNREVYKSMDDFLPEVVEYLFDLVENKLEVEELLNVILIPNHSGSGFF